jgi:DNA-directed RNA polymerase subunit RPC12/RpoP
VQIEFRCRRCKKPIQYDPARPYRCPHCGESYAGDLLYDQAKPAIDQCALCRSQNLVKQKWTQRFVGPGAYFFMLILIIPSRGMSFLFPLLAKWLLDWLMPYRVLCKSCGCVHTGAQMSALGNKR